MCNQQKQQPGDKKVLLRLTHSLPHMAVLKAMIGKEMVVAVMMMKSDGVIRLAGQNNLGVLDKVTLAPLDKIEKKTFLCHQ